MMQRIFATAAFSPVLIRAPPHPPPGRWCAVSNRVSGHGNGYETANCDWDLILNKTQSIKRIGNTQK